MKNYSSRLCAGILAALTAWSSATVCPAWAEEVEQRPRIGLVLSGGAARGSAHVGVLKVLEELQIPIDFVAGTSMGAIVGGLYSAGVSPAEMELILSETDWRDLLDDQPPRRHLPYRRKVDDQNFLARFEAGFNGGSFQIPSGLISGQKLGFALQLMALQTVGIEDFDQFPIPFRAVATDLETGEPVILSRGDLGRAMRASMSLPGIFSPIEIEGRLLVDGGLVRNLPVDVARDLGADVIIAVDVGESLPEKDELRTISSITSQVMGLQIYQNVQKQAAAADILIKPSLEGFGSSQFERGIEMVPFGEQAAREAEQQLRSYSVSEESYRAFQERLRRPRSLEGKRITSVQLSASSTANPEFLFRQIEIQSGDPLDLESIRRDLQRLFETGDYERVDFRLLPSEEGFDLIIEALDKPWGPNYLRFGVGLFADFEGESFFNLLSSYTMTRLNSRRGELKVQTLLGEDPTLLAELYQPLSLSQTLFAAASLRQSTSTVDFAVGGGATVPYRVDSLELGLDLGVQLGRFAELRLGVIRSRFKSELRVDSDVPSDFPREAEGDSGALRFSAVVDQFDSVNFPRNGYFAAVNVLASREGLGAEQDYEELFTFLGLAGTRGRHTVLSLLNLYSALGSDSPRVYDLGDLFGLSGVSEGTVTGRYGGSLALLYLYRLFDLPTGLGNGVYLGASLEAGNLWLEQDQVDFGDLRYAASVSIGVDTAFGPLYLASGFAENGDSALYLLVGRSF